VSVEERQDVEEAAERTRRRTRDFAESTRETAQDMTEMAKERLKDLIDTTDAQINKLQSMTRESPGTALTVTFIAGLAIGGIVALLALSRGKE
jgi:ElaB/YqjD/DUF883 family membrane-anchored ribosome-binding protein